MGLFGKEKTQLDYLKEIADSQKKQATSGRIKAIGSFLNERKIARAEAAEATANQRFANAQAQELEMQSYQMQVDLNKKALDACKKDLELFYAQFDYDTKCIDDIIKKCEAIIFWLDTLDRKEKSKKSEFDVGGSKPVVINNDNKSKEAALMCKLHAGVDKLNELKADKSLYEKIENKLKSYEERDVAKKEAARAKKTMAKRVFFSILFAIFIIIVISLLPNAKEDEDYCNSKIAKAIAAGEIEKAKKYALQFRSSRMNHPDGTALIKIYLDKEDLLSAELIAANTDGNNLLVDYFVEKSLYDKAAEYVPINTSFWWDREKIFYYLSACVKDMCKHGKYNEARKFIKIESNSRYDNDYYKEEDCKKLNAIVSTYAKNK